MKIIVVDDEMSALQAFLGEIIGEDVEYKFYRDDAEAVCEYAAKGGVNAAFLDIRMPKPTASNWRSGCCGSIRPSRSSLSRGCL